MDKFFQFEKYGTNFKTEIVAGITSFLATMYIIIVNPNILSACGMSFDAVLTATILVSAFSSIAMGIYAKNPIIVAPGMGINAFFSFTVVIGMKVPWEIALGSVFWAGIFFLILSIFNIRKLIVEAIPKPIRLAVSGGIGLFITLIGLEKAKFIVANPATLISFGGLNEITITFIIGLLFTSILVIKRIKGALIIGIVFTTLLAIPIGRFYGTDLLVTWSGIFSKPDFSLIFKLDLINSLKFAIWPIIFSFIFTDMFDSLSTFVGVAEAGNLKDEKGEPRFIKESLIADAFSTTISGLLGSSPGTSYIESATGISEGGRTGLTAIVAGLLFIPFMFVAPILKIVPDIAISTALVLVGVFMMAPIAKIDWEKLDDSIPAFLALFLIPTTYSITLGIVWGFISWTFIKIVLGKFKEINWMLIIIVIFAIIDLLLR